MNLNRRRFLGATVAAASPALAAPAAPRAAVGVVMYSIRSAKLTPFAYLDYLAGIGVGVARFSSATLGINPAAPDLGALKRVRDHAAELGITLPTLAGRSICSSSSRFDPKLGTAEQQIRCQRGSRSRFMHQRHSRALMCVSG